MDLAAAGLREQAFRTHEEPVCIVSYSSHLDGIEVLQETHASPGGIALIQGPALSGKSTLIRQFVDTIPGECAYAIVDGDGKSTKSLLRSLLRQFGYDADISTKTELLGMTRVFAQQQAASQEPPIVIVENAHGLGPGAMGALGDLAKLRVGDTYALKMVLMSDQSLRAIVDAPAMECISDRVSADYHLRPMSCDEATKYVHTKLSAAGSLIPSFVMPTPVCNDLWAASGGWPGILDRVALLALAKAETLPVETSHIERPGLPDGTWDVRMFDEAHEVAGEALDPPTLYVTEHGKETQELKFEKSQLLLGRTEHNDICIDSDYVSRHHLLLIRHGRATFLMDLNSTNGTFVNSRPVTNQLLIDDDVIIIGNHRIKFCDPLATQRGTLDRIEFADTAIMKTLDDMRKRLLQGNTSIMPLLRENQAVFNN